MTASQTGAKRAMFVAAATVLALSLSASALASGGSDQREASDTAPAPAAEITVDVLAVNGSGCPAGTADVTVTPDSTGFHVSYKRYVARVGRGAGPTDFRKNCQFSLLVHVPQGFTYAIAKTDYRGFAYLASGATGLMRANYYFQGSPDNTYSDHPFAGPHQGRWQAIDETESAHLIYAPCGVHRVLNVNTELRVSAGRSDVTKTTSLMAMRSTDGSINTIYHFAWKRCR